MRTVIHFSWKRKSGRHGSLGKRHWMRHRGSGRRGNLGALTGLNIKADIRPFILSFPLLLNPPTPPTAAPIARQRPLCAKSVTVTTKYRSQQRPTKNRIAPALPIVAPIHFIFVLYERSRRH